MVSAGDSKSFSPGSIPGIPTMGTIFKYKNQLIQCRDLQKKLKRMKLSVNDIEIIQDNIPLDELEKTFVNLTNEKKKEDDGEYHCHYYIFQNPRGHYLWGINSPSIDYYKKWGTDISEYTLIDECIGVMPREYRKWNPETKTGIKIMSNPFYKKYYYNPYETKEEFLDKLSSDKNFCGKVLYPLTRFLSEPMQEALHFAVLCAYNAVEDKETKVFAEHVLDCGCEGCALDADIIEGSEENKETDPIKELAFKLNTMSETQAISYLDVITGKAPVFTNVDYVGKETLTEVVKSDNASKYTREIIRKFLEKWE